MQSISRRGFLKHAAAYAAAPYIVPASVLGLGGAVAPSNRIVMGAIGVGGQGTGNMNRFLRDPGVQMVGVCDVDRAHLMRAKDMVDQFHGDTGCAAYNDFRELLARTDIDAICVGTPDHNHGIVTVAAAKSGKDIYCEKPLANTIAEGRATCNAVKSYGRVLQTGSHERSRDNARYACELVRNGRIGKLHTIRVNLPVDDHDLFGPAPPMPVPDGFDYDMWLGPCPYEPYTERRCHFYFRYILDYSGGEVTDRGAHIIDLGQLGHGSDDTGPVEVWGWGKFFETPLFNTAYDYNFEFTYADGVKMICGNVRPRGIRFEGTDGWVFIYIHGGDLEAEPASLLTEKIGPNEIHLGRSPNHHADFLNAVKTRGTTKAPAEVGHRTATMCHLANIAMLTGRKLKWDPVAERVTNDDGANRMCLRPMRAPWQV